MNKEHWAGSGHLEALMKSAHSLIAQNKEGHSTSTLFFVFFFTFLFNLALLSPVQSQKASKDREQNISVSK